MDERGRSVHIIASPDGIIPVGERARVEIIIASPQKDTRAVLLRDGKLRIIASQDSNTAEFAHVVENVVITSR